MNYLAPFFLAASLLLVSSTGFAAPSDASANLRLMAFGGDAQLKAINHAVARFNQKYPNVKVEIAIDPIIKRLGRLCHPRSLAVQRQQRL